MTVPAFTQSALAPALDITGHMDGCALWGGDTIIEVFPSFWDASTARSWAHEALCMLSASLARKMGEG